MRTELLVFRKRQKLSQEQMAAKIGCSRVSYASIENGKRKGSQEFWLAFQETFKVADEEMWGLMKCDED